MNNNHRLNATKLSATELNATELNATELNATELNVTELNVTELNVTKLNATELNSTKNVPVSAIRAYLGGSFNPVHHGHIQMAMQVYDCLATLAAQQQRPLQVALLPNVRSPFKDQTTDPTHRLAMLNLAIKNTPLQISELELWQEPPVYTIDSVRTLRQRYPNDSLIFIMGMDSARSLDKWKDGLQLTNYVHLWIFNRTDNANSFNDSYNAQPKPIANHSVITYKLNPQNSVILCAELPIQLQAQVTDSAADLTRPLNETLETGKRLKSNAQGRIYIDPRQVTAISSTQIRQQLGGPALKPSQIDAFTATNQIHSLTKCLNPTVYQYIIAHQLYSAAQFR
jgi:nicotinate-nucleotide adenylyltransferase